MELLPTLLGLVVVAGVVWLVSAPLRAQAAGRRTPAQERDAQHRRDLELERDRAYADIRELEMDLRTGKLSEEDYRATERQLRAEAVNILHELDRMGPDPGEEGDDPGDGTGEGDADGGGDASPAQTI